MMGLKNVRALTIVLAGLTALPAVASPAPAPVAAPAQRPPQFAMCGVCHKTGAGEKSTMGPNLWRIGGRRAGTAEGYTLYSPAMKSANVVWNREKLIAFVSNPKAVVPGTKMTYAGQKDPKVAAQIADYVLSLK